MAASLSKNNPPPDTAAKEQLVKGKGYRAKKPLGCEPLAIPCDIPPLIGKKEYFECGYPIQHIYSGFRFMFPLYKLKFIPSNHDLKVITPESTIILRNFFKIRNWKRLAAYCEDTKFTFSQLITQKVKRVQETSTECHNYCDEFMKHFDLRMNEPLVYMDISLKDAKPCNDAARTHRRKSSEVAFFRDRSDTPSTSERIRINAEYMSTVISVACKSGVKEVWATFAGERKNIYKLKKNTAPIVSFDVNGARIFFGYNRNKTAILALPCAIDTSYVTLNGLKGQEFRFGIEVIDRDGISSRYTINFHY